MNTTRTDAIKAPVGPGTVGGDIDLADSEAWTPPRGTGRAVKYAAGVIVNGVKSAAAQLRGRLLGGGESRGGSDTGKVSADWDVEKGAK